MTKDLTIEEIREQKKRQLIIQFENDKNASEATQPEKTEHELKQEKNDLLLKQVLVTEAYQYLKQRSIDLQEKTLSSIKRMLSTGELSYGYQLTLIGLKRLERKIMGIEPSITIRRRGKDDVKLS
ncbi:MAG: hypothetical protein ACTSYA_07955 [Candidatus Kariarchaeaceae archaeon]